MDNIFCKSFYFRIFLFLSIGALLCTPMASFSEVSSGSPSLRLNRFLQMKSFKASFSQVVYDAKHSVIDDSLGTIVISRPGRFRWEYTEPNRQSIVSDGLNLIIYDPDLNQASVQPVVKALGDAPITMLMSYRPLSDRFDIENGNHKEGLDWIYLSPKVQDIEFTRIGLGLDDEKVARIEMLDHFEQTTVIKFLHADLTPDIASDEFHVYLPKTVDVIGEYLLPVLIPTP